MYALSLATGGILGHPEPLSRATLGRLFIESDAKGGKYTTAYKDIAIESQIRLDEQDMVDLVTILVRSGILDE
jgi:hypothetical protein